MYTRLQPILLVPDVEQEKHFYLALGFQVHFEDQDFVAITDGAHMLFGLQHAPKSNPKQFIQHCIWQIGTQSVAVVARRCAEHQLPIEEEPTEQAWGEWTLIVRSPTGMRVTFEGPLGENI